MKQKQMPFTRYTPYPVSPFPERTWPDTVITHAPIWCSVDLRDGNQALPTPMNCAEKIEMFDLLVAIGFKEIEVAFPSASHVEFDFVRRLIEEERIPHDVTIQVLTQAREPLIRRTFEAVRGARSACIHVYNSTSTIQRKVVFRKNRKEIIAIARDAAIAMREMRSIMNGTRIQFEYTPESFTGTEPDFALEICEQVIDEWRPTPDNKVCINLPATIEMSTPNVYADRIEWFSRSIKKRDSIIVSVHTHNDRGTSVAAAELAVMAGAERVEGSLFGNGERTGNMDIMTMALNLFSQGVDPMLDFRDINKISDIYSRCTRLALHARHPYAGDLVYTAFSGSHQDAIHKGMKAQEASSCALWNVPYLPIDPRDVGRDYESIIRINSQSGKGGVAYIMSEKGGFVIPKEMQPDFSRVIQKKAESVARELSADEIVEAFKTTYLHDYGEYKLSSVIFHTGDTPENNTRIECSIKTPDGNIQIAEHGNGVLDGFMRGVRAALKIDIEVEMYYEHALEKGANADAVAYIGIRVPHKEERVYGVGVDPNISTASVKGVVSALNRL